MCRCSIRIVFPFGEGVGGVASKGNILSSSALAPTLWLRPHSAPLMEIHVLCFPYIYTIHSDKLKSTSFQKATISNKIKSTNYKKKNTALEVWIWGFYTEMVLSISSPGHNILPIVYGNILLKLLNRLNGSAGDWFCQREEFLEQLYA